MLRLFAAGPTIVIPPEPHKEPREGDTVVITCSAVGIPIPLISWRLNWGNVPDPPHVTATSDNGVGTLTIRNFQQSDQGAYSCEAINNQNAIIATPDSIVTIQGRDIMPFSRPNFYSVFAWFVGTQSDICQPPLFNAAARTPQECVQCYCSGVTQNCRSCAFHNSNVGLLFRSLIA